MFSCQIRQAAALHQRPHRSGPKPGRRLYNPILHSQSQTGSVCDMTNLCSLPVAVSSPGKGIAVTAAGRAARIAQASKPPLIKLDPTSTWTRAP